MELGEHWAYRSSRRGKFLEVTIKAIGTKSPPRVKILWVDDAYEGRTEWVSPARLEVKWSEVDEYSRRYKLWRALGDAPAPTSFEAEALASVLYSATQDAPIDLWGGESRGIACFEDVGAVQEETGLTEAELTEDPLTIVENGWTYVPWSLTERIVRACAHRHADLVMALIEKEEREYERKSVLGSEFRWTRNDPLIEVPGEIYARYFEEHISKVHALLREWVGVDASARRQDLVDLRAELSRVGNLAQRAILELKCLRSNRNADALLNELLNPPSKWHGYGVDAEKVAPYRTPYKWVLRDLPADE